MTMREHLGLLARIREQLESRVAHKWSDSEQWAATAALESAYREGFAAGAKAQREAQLQLAAANGFGDTFCAPLVTPKEQP